jgi:predicted transcriptional regulator
MDKERIVTLQARVDAKCAQRVAALAKAMDVTQAQLLRQAIDELLVKSESNVDALRDRIQEQMPTGRGAPTTTAR